MISATVLRPPLEDNAYWRHHRPVYEHREPSRSPSDHSSADDELAEFPETARSASIAARTANR